MGLTKGFSQSLLAFCPPPISWKSLFSLCGGGHTANQALLDSLCKTLVIPPNTMSNLSRFSTLEHQGENPIHTTPSPFCLFSLMMHHMHCQFQLFIYLLYLASFIIHNFSGSLFCKKREKPLIMKKGYSPCYFSSLIHLLQALILILYCNFRVYETDFKLLRNPSFLILSYYGFSQSDVTLFFSCVAGVSSTPPLCLFQAKPWRVHDQGKPRCHQAFFYISQPQKRRKLMKEETVLPLKPEAPVSLWKNLPCIDCIFV